MRNTGLLTWRNRARQTLLAGFLVALVFAVAPAAHADAAASERGDVSRQQRGEWCFEEDGLAFDNVLEGARLNGVLREAPGRYRLFVEPEIEPINPSPWYSFRLSVQRAGAVMMVLDYGDFDHRYWPWLRHSFHGGRVGPWRRATETEFSVGDDGLGELSLAVLPGTRVEVSAQTPLPVRDVDQWLDGLAHRTGGDLELIGRSAQGRPLRALVFGDAGARETVLVIGRQHPPEVTGARALIAFVDQVAGDTALARGFRDRYQVLVIPQLNPDGVVDGHWRTNANGTDLNRDWGLFQEPETQAVAAALHRHLAESGNSLAFALDFHSTWYDIFYTVSEDPSRNPGGVLRTWMDSLDARFPGRIRERPSAATSNVFKNWVFREYRSPSVTYEVGDETDAATLSEVASFAATSMMETLLAVDARRVP